jgi:hypothetical protein
MCICYCFVLKINSELLLNKDQYKANSFSLPLYHNHPSIYVNLLFVVCLIMVKPLTIHYYKFPLKSSPWCILVQVFNT